jgi:hypothetical protein
MANLEIKDVSEEEFQSTFEACGDSDPYALVLDGEVIGLVNVRYSPEQLKALKLAIARGTDPRYSTVVECPTCGAEVDVRTADPL